MPSPKGKLVIVIDSRRNGHIVVTKKPEICVDAVHHRGCVPAVVLNESPSGLSYDGAVKLAGAVGRGLERIGFDIKIENPSN